MASYIKDFTYHPDLTSRLDGYGKNDKFTRSTFDEITLWKVSRYPDINEEIIDAVNELAQYDTLDEATDSLKRALNLLLNAKGVRLAMASTYLRFRNPQVFQIIDQRVYRQVQIIWYKRDPNPKNPKLKLTVPRKIENQIDLYVQYLRDLRSMCQKENVEFFEADRVFYMKDKGEKHKVNY